MDAANRADFLGSKMYGKKQQQEKQKMDGGRKNCFHGLDAPVCEKNEYNIAECGSQRASPQRFEPRKGCEPMG
jgi:hypothetical protein